MVRRPRREGAQVRPSGFPTRGAKAAAQIASAISTIAGGGIIIAAAVYFGMLDTSWLPA